MPSTVSGIAASGGVKTTGGTLATVKGSLGPPGTTVVNLASVTTMVTVTVAPVSRINRDEPWEGASEGTDTTKMASIVGHDPRAESGEEKSGWT